MERCITTDEKVRLNNLTKRGGPIASQLASYDNFNQKHLKCSQWHRID